MGNNQTIVYNNSDEKQSMNLLYAFKKYCDDGNSCHVRRIKDAYVVSVYSYHIHFNSLQSLIDFVSKLNRQFVLCPDEYRGYNLCFVYGKL